VAQKYNLEKIFERKKAVEFLLLKINAIEDEVIKSIYIKKFATVFEVDENVVKEDMKKQINKARFPTAGMKSDKTPPNNVNGDVELSRIPVNELYMLALLTKPDLKEKAVYLGLLTEEHFTVRDSRDLFTEIKNNVENKKKLDTKEFYDKLQHNNPEAYNLFTSIYLMDLGDRLNSDSVLAREAAEAIKRLDRSYLNRELKKLTEAIKKAEALSDGKKLQKLQAQVENIRKKII
jgi:hypothetical protein